jgi:hypothetical protein
LDYKCLDCSRPFVPFSDGNSYLCNECLKSMLGETKEQPEERTNNKEQITLGICDQCEKEDQLLFKGKARLCLICFEKYYHSFQFNKNYL